MERYKQVIVDCFKDSRFSHYGECYWNITPQALEEKLNQLAKEGWMKFEVVINGKKQAKDIS